MSVFWTVTAVGCSPMTSVARPPATWIRPALIISSHDSFFNLVNALVTLILILLLSIIIHRVMIQNRERVWNRKRSVMLCWSFAFCNFLKQIRSKLRPAEVGKRPFQDLVIQVSNTEFTLRLAHDSPGRTLLLLKLNHVSDGETNELSGGVSLCVSL